MKAARALRALARVEWRQLRAHPGRSLLLLLLVAVPVAAVVGGATLAAITEPTAEEQRVRAMGRATLRVDLRAAPEASGGRPDALPAGTRVEPMFLGAEMVAVPGRRLEATLVALAPAALDSPGLAHGMLRLAAGRAPRNSGEVALAPVLLEGLGRSVGDTVTLEYGARRTITGIVVDPENLDQPIVLRTAAAVEGRGTHALLLAPPAASADSLATMLRRAGFAVRTRAEAGTGGGGLASLVFALGTIGFFEAALVIAAAFAVGLRRRRHEIGLLGSTGATPGGITAALVASAAALATVGGMAGAVAGMAGAALVHPRLDDWNHRLNGGFEVRPEHLAGALLLGIVAAVLAAAIPAWGAARVPIRAALGGQRPVTTRPRAGLGFGLAALTLGLGLLALAPRGDAKLAGLAVVAGPILGILGFGLASPWLLDGLARRAAPLPLALRLAVRDAGRFRARNGPVVTAVLAGMSMSVTVALLSASLESALDAFPARYRADQLLVEGPGAAEVVRQMRAELQCVAAAPLMAVYAAGQPVRARFPGVAARRFTREWVACGDDALLRALGIESSAAAFAAGRLIVLDPPPGVADIELTTWLDGRRLDAPPIAFAPLAQRVSEPLFVLDEAALAGLGLDAGPPLNRSLVPWLVRLDTPVTPTLLARAQEIAASSTGVLVDADRLHRRPTRGAWRAVFLVCLLTGLIVVLVATSLSAAESAADERALRSVGAAPGLIRRHAAARAGYLAFLGCLLALPAGLMTAVALVRAANFPLALVLPWRDLGITLVGLPALASGVAWLFGSEGWRGPAPRGAIVGLALLGLAAAPDAAVGATAAPVAIRWEQHVGKAFDGSPLVGELGRIRVPERHGVPGGATIELAFVRYRTTNPNPGAPIFFLAGGPGGSGVELCGSYATHPQVRLLEQRDVIGLDQRGTGASRPNICDAPLFRHELPPDRAIDRADVVAALGEATRRCVSYWTRRGVDLAAYNSQESADDLDDLRRALGQERVVLVGSSYGSHLGLAYLRRHGAHAERALFMNVEGPDQTWKLPADTQRQLERLHAEVAADPLLSNELPDLLGAVRRLLAQLESAPVTVTPPAGQPEQTPVVVGAYDLRCALAQALASATERAGIPALLIRASRGDWTSPAAVARENRRIDAVAMPLQVDCASGGTAERRRRIERERRDPTNLLGDALAYPLYPEECAACGNPDLGDAFRGPLDCPVPVLFVSGTLDARTPPRNVEEIRAGFTHHAHLRVENAGHDARELMSDEYRRLMQAFLRGEPVESATIRLPPVRFEAPPPGVASPQ